MWILNVKFHDASTIFNISVIGFSMYFCLKDNKDLYLFIYHLFVFTVWESDFAIWLFRHFAISCFKHAQET